MCLGGLGEYFSPIKMDFAFALHNYNGTGTNRHEFQRNDAGMHVRCGHENCDALRGWKSQAHVLIQPSLLFDSGDVGTQLKATVSRLVLMDDAIPAD